jgi:hypothetical protein
MLITISVIQFNDAYYKGTTQSNTQDVARTILQNISQAVQFNGGQITSPIGTVGSGSSVGFCIGDSRYSYLLGWQLVSGTVNPALHQTNHVLVEDNPGTCSGLDAQDMQDASVSGTELLSPNMRLSALSVTAVTGSNDLYKINVRVVYGADDLLYSPGGTVPAATAPDATCKLETGDQFCAVSNLSTIVQSRIN